MVEFAGCVGYRYGTASLTGAGRTPWNPDHWSGGSSSGSGAAVAAGLVGFAIGTETWGSILCPSAFCGTTGLRPTAGRVSRGGAMALSWTMDKIGPMTRTVQDAAIILELISGADGGRDAGLRPAHEAAYAVPRALPSVKGMRLGIVHPDYGKDAEVQPQTQAAFVAALDVLKRLGADYKEVTLPEMPTDEAAGTIVVAEAASAFEDVTRDGHAFNLVVDPEMRGGLVANLALPAVDYIRALRVRALAQQTLPSVFAGIDALIAPSYLVVAPAITASLDQSFPGSDNGLSGLGNMLGLPAVGVPMGFGPGTLPLGMQFVGAPMKEDVVLALAAAYQEATDWHARRPPLFS
jgi:aspartyl-tRNA(Asn)/glutamyl-tRNA(Gln) amidotransferase subunit A